MSRTLWSESISTGSTATTIPSASPIAPVSCASVPAASSISTRIVRRYWALGVTLLTEDGSWIEGRGGRAARHGRPGILFTCRAAAATPTNRVIDSAPSHAKSHSKATGRGHSKATGCGRSKTTGRAQVSAAALTTAEQERRLFLIDGPSLVYRAFYALPESIATSTGVPTNAIFGFASMLVKIVTEYGVCPTVVAWDAGTSGRAELFADYKATRRSRPDLLKAQWPC